MEIKRTHHIKAVIQECFGSDSDLVSKWHIAAGSGLSACVAKTLLDIDKFDPSFQFFTAYDRHVLVGYFGLEFGNYINLIFVKPQYRTKAFMREFWAEIKKRVSDPFFTAVYEKNLPAIGFYSRHGIEIDRAPLPDGTAIVFEFKNDRSL